TTHSQTFSARENHMATDVMFPDRAATNDTWQWLEGIYDDDALKWVDEQNARTMGSFDALTLQKTAATILEILDSDDRIPMIAKHGEYYYNFWRDAEHPRGLWRRTTLESYRTPKPDWGVLLDIDALGREEGVEWVFAGAQMLPHSYDRALLRLSPDGGDAVVIREFDVESREFVADGFSIPHAKSQVSWIDCDTIFVGSDFGPGTMTTSSYPRQARRWRRGEPLETAEIIHEIPEDHMALWAYHDSTPGFERAVLIDRVDFFSGKTCVLRENQPIQVDIPDDADAAFHREWLLVRTRSRWEVGGETYPA